MAINRRPGGGGRPSLPPELDAIDSAWGGDRIPTSSAPPPIAPALPPLHLDELARERLQEGARLAFGSESPTQPRDPGHRAPQPQPTEPSLQRAAILPEAPVPQEHAVSPAGRDARTVPNRPERTNEARAVDRNRATDPAPVRPSSSSQLGARRPPTGSHELPGLRRGAETERSARSARGPLSHLEAERMASLDTGSPALGSPGLGSAGAGSSGIAASGGLSGTLASLRGGSFKRTIASLGGLAPSTPPDEPRPTRDQYPGGSPGDTHDRPTADPAGSWAATPAAPRGVLPPATNRGSHGGEPLVLERDPAQTEIRHSEAPTAPPPDDIERLRLASIPRASSVEQVELAAQSQGGSLPPQPAISSRGRSVSPPEGQRATEAQRPSARLGGAPRAAAERPSSPAEEMRDRFSMGDFSGALERAETILALNPADAEARTMAARCSDVLFEMYSSRVGDFSRGVRVVMSPEKLRWLSLDHRAGFLLSLVDGVSSIDELLDVSGMKRLDAVRQIANLLEQKVIELL